MLILILGAMFVFFGTALTEFLALYSAPATLGAEPDVAAVTSIVTSIIANIIPFVLVMVPIIIIL